MTKLYDFTKFAKDTMITKSQAYELGYQAAASKQYFDKNDARARALTGAAEMGAGAEFERGWNTRRKEMGVDPKAIGKSAKDAGIEKGSWYTTPTKRAISDVKKKLDDGDWTFYGGTLSQNQLVSGSTYNFKSRSGKLFTVTVE